VYDHLVNLLDLTENYRELSSSLLDLYNTQVSNNMNEIMKVLTMISAIFIPLSFIAGVYGMNFSPTNKQGLPLPLNMPELYQPNGYIWAVAIMLGIAVLQLLLFWYKGWFKRW
jgi:magnesium transporter